MNKAVVVLATCLPLMACDDPVGIDDTDLVVVEAFLFAGEPVRDVRLTSTVGLGEDPSLALAIDDADVRLLKNGLTYLLVPTGDSGRYEYPGADLQVSEGDTFLLEVAYFGKTASAETVVPAPPINVDIDGDTLFAPVLGGGGGRGAGGFNSDSARLAVTWDNPSELLHFVVVDGLEDSTEAIFPEQVRQRLSRFRLITRPTTDTFFTVNLLLLRDLGLHQAKVYRVNEEYADLYENRTQDSRDLNEPPTNMRNGLGIFSAFNGIAVPFEVARAQP